MYEVKQHIDQIRKLCESTGVATLFVFGSVVANNLNSKSDIDFVVNFDEQDPLKYSDKYFALKSGLESFFNRSIDLLEERAIRNSFLKSKIDQTKVLVYGR